MKIKTYIFIIIVGFIGFLTQSLCLSQSSKIATAKSIKGASLHIDGILNDSVWLKATPLSDFLQKDPKEGELPDGQIEIRFLYDEQYLYIGAKMSHPNEKEIRAVTSRRDEVSNSERIIISLDTYKDKRTAYTFGLTATGVRFDYSHQNDNEYNRDYSFDPVWNGDAVIDSVGWTAELRIPFTQLRFNAREEQEWGLNINWWIPSMRQDVYWVLVPKNDAGWSSRMGSLIGIKNIKPSNRIELLPYVAANLINDPEGGGTNPYTKKNEVEARAGLDFKMGLGSDFSLDATVNPDFGQVEADPAVVNLTAYEIFFDEKRPFFIEGKRLLQGYSNSFFYSRRIGQAPKANIEGDIIDIPNNSTILGAAKITGRTGEGLSLGALSAITDREYGMFNFTVNDSTGEVLLGPLTSYNVIRLKQEFGEDVSSIGLLLTNVYRDISPGSTISRYYVKDAISGDADWQYRFNNATYQFDGHFGFSYLYGDSSAITNIQRSSSHYFQRPDANHVSVDSSANSISGFTGGAKFSKIAGEHWLWEVNSGFESPGLELNDIGQFTAGDEIFSKISLSYRENKPGSIFYSYYLYSDYYNGWDFGGNQIGKAVSFANNATFYNRSVIDFKLWYYFPSLSNNKTRGGPLMGTYDSWGTSLNYTSDWTSDNQWGFTFQGNKDILGGWYASAQLKFTLKFLRRMQLSFEPNYQQGIDPRQYIKTMDNGSAATYGSRFIFAYVERKTLSAKFRFNLAFSGDFSLEFYAEPFAANGRFYNFGELVKPKTYDLKHYGDDGTTITGDGKNYYVTDGFDFFRFSNPNFNLLSYRSNLVLRWEYLPGSTMYLVWQQNKSDYRTNPKEVGIGSLADSYNTAGINSLTFKISYWLPLN